MFVLLCYGLGNILHLGTIKQEHHGRMHSNILIITGYLGGLLIGDYNIVIQIYKLYYTRNHNQNNHQLLVSDKYYPPLSLSHIVVFSWFDGDD